MRTAMIIAVGFLLLGALAVFSKLFVQHYPNATTWAVYGFVVLWLAATGFNMWVGVNKAGYSVGEELPIMLLLLPGPCGYGALAKVASALIFQTARLIGATLQGARSWVKPG